jgi:hypothetical protein
MRQLTHFPWDDPEGFVVEVNRLAPDGSSHYPFPDDAEEREQLPEGDPLPRAMAAWQAILLVQLIDVLGARQVELSIPRPHRRAHERRHQHSHPAVYFVDLRQAGDQKPGSGREYRHRWLVRGHWRHLADGRRTWVRPYVKGPAGAPWRGRPIYVDRTKG